MRKDSLFEDGSKLKILELRKNETFMELRSRVSRTILRSLVEGEQGSDISDFRCSYDDKRLYQFEWVEPSGGSRLAAFIEPKDTNKFITKSKKLANEVGFGFDPLNSDGYEVIVEVFVFSPNSVPERELRRLMKTDAEVIVVT